MANEQAAVWGPVVSVLVIALSNLIAWAANENSWIFKHCLKPLGMRPLLFISNRCGFDQLCRNAMQQLSAVRACQ
jgi:hypothetical protein